MRRKTLASAFYKEKLHKMVEVIRECSRLELAEWKADLARGINSFDLIQKIQNYEVKIILTCAFGEEYDDKKVKWYVNGELTTTTLGFCLRRLFEQCFRRNVNPCIFFFPSLTSSFRLTGNSEILKNAALVRTQIREMVADRKSGKTKSRFEGADLLSILLTDEIFQASPEGIVDEILTFFFAGSQTSGCAVSNCLAHLIQDPTRK